MRQMLVAVIGSLLLLGTGCTVGTKPSYVSTDTLEKQLSDGLAKKVGQRPDDVACPKRLKAEKGARARCVITAGTDKLGVTVTTTAVKDSGKVDFSFQVDQKMLN